MGRKAHIPLEIDFLFGLDGKGFTRLTMTERMVFLYLWSHVWHSGIGQNEGQKSTDLADQDPTITLVEARNVLKMGLASPKHLNKYLTNIGQISLIEYDGKTVKFLGLHKKRQAAFRGGGASKRDQTSPPAVPNRKEKEYENTKEYETKENQLNIHEILSQDLSKIPDPEWRLAARFMRDITPSFSRSLNGRLKCRDHFKDLLRRMNESEIETLISEAELDSQVWDIGKHSKHQKPEKAELGVVTYPEWEETLRKGEQG